MPATSPGMGRLQGGVLAGSLVLGEGIVAYRRCLVGDSKTVAHLRGASNPFRDDRLATEPMFKGDNSRHLATKTTRLRRFPEEMCGLFCEAGDQEYWTHDN